MASSHHFHQRQPPGELPGIFDFQVCRIGRVVGQCEGRVLVGAERADRVILHPPGPPEHAHVELEDGPRVAAGEDDRDHRRDAEHDERDPQKGQHDIQRCGNVTVYKARLVAKGFRQIQGIDYDETFSPVAKLKSIRVLLAIAAYFDYEIWQMDVKTAFLNGNIEEELYMMQPEGFVDPKDAGKVCKLQRSIYGLKQASRSWNHRFDSVIKEFGFVQNEDETCIYKKVSGSSVAFLVLYVDDILIIGNDVNLLNSVKE